MAIDWENLKGEELKWLHEWGRDAEIRANGYGDQLDKYISAMSSESPWDWNPNDMVGTPARPVPSALNKSGQRETVTVRLPGQDDDEDIPPYEEWDSDDLRKECLERGLEPTGTKDDLVLRLMEHDEATEQTETPPPEYDTMRKAELQDLCRERGLDPQGKNDELIARLQEWDRSHAG
jgi:hypothetical protein